MGRICIFTENPRLEATLDTLGQLQEVLQLPRATQSVTREISKCIRLLKNRMGERVRIQFVGRRGRTVEDALARYCQHSLTTCMVDPGMTEMMRARSLMADARVR